MKCFDVMNLLLNSINIVGIFVAIVVGMVVSKIMSFNAEKSELNVNINDSKNKLNEIKKQYDNLISKKQTMCKEKIGYELLNCFERMENYAFINEYIEWMCDEYVTIEFIENFHQNLHELLTKFDRVKNNHQEINKFMKENNVLDNSIEYKILLDSKRGKDDE